MTTLIERAQPHELFVGALVDWMHTPRGGYGFTYPVPAKVIALSGDRAQIEVTTKTGHRVTRRVLSSSLCWRQT